MLHYESEETEIRTPVDTCIFPVHSLVCKKLATCDLFRWPGHTLREKQLPITENFSGSQIGKLGNVRNLPGL